MWYVLVQEPRRANGPSPTLATVHRIESVLRKAARRGEGPLSYAEIERRLPVKKIRRDTLKAALHELARFHLVAQGSKGVMWVQATSDAVWNRPRESLK